MEGNFMFPLISLSISLFIQLVKQGKEKQWASGPLSDFM